MNRFVYLRSSSWNFLLFESNLVEPNYIDSFVFKNEVDWNLFFYWIEVFIIFNNDFLRFIFKNFFLFYLYNSILNFQFFQYRYC